MRETTEMMRFRDGRTISKEARSKLFFFECRHQTRDSSLVSIISPTCHCLPHIRLARIRNSHLHWFPTTKKRQIWWLTNEERLFLFSHSFLSFFPHFTLTQLCPPSAKRGKKEERRTTRELTCKKKPWFLRVVKKQICQKYGLLESKKVAHAKPSLKMTKNNLKLFWKNAANGRRGPKLGLPGIVWVRRRRRHQICIRKERIALAGWMH